MSVSTARGRNETAGATQELDENENRNSFDSESRRSSQPPQISPYQFYYNSRGRPPTAEEEEQFQICVILITTWLFMIASGLFLTCYVYVLEWSPETSDPIHVFSLELAVNILYLMFVIDFCAGIVIIVSKMEYMRPFHLRIFWPAVGCLCLNHFHGTVIWLWVWTGEFPRTCARNTFYFGRKCSNVIMAIVDDANSDGTLDLADCKCDYGQCLPECKGLRVIQHYFWGTYWLYALRMLCLIIYIPPLRKAVCQCRCCCCVNVPHEEPRRIRRVSRVSAQSPVHFMAPPTNRSNNQNNNIVSCKCSNASASTPKPPDPACHCSEKNEKKEQENNIRIKRSLSKKPTCTQYCQSTIVSVATAPVPKHEIKVGSPVRKVSQGTGETGLCGW